MQKKGGRTFYRLVSNEIYKQTRRRKGIMREQIADICRKAKYSIRNFSSDPVNSLEYLIPIAIFLIGIINGIVTQRAFTHNGGYGAQMDAIKE